MEANSSELDQELLLLAKCRYSNNYMNDGQIWVKICETSEVNHDTVLLFSDFQEPLQGGVGGGGSSRVSLFRRGGKERSAE